MNSKSENLKPNNIFYDSLTHLQELKIKNFLILINQNKPLQLQFFLGYVPALRLSNEDTIAILDNLMNCYVYLNLHFEDNKGLINALNVISQGFIHSYNFISFISMKSMKFIYKLLQDAITANFLPLKILLEQWHNNPNYKNFLCTLQINHNAYKIFMEKLLGKNLFPVYLIKLLEQFNNQTPLETLQYLHKNLFASQNKLMFLEFEGTNMLKLNPHPKLSLFAAKKITITTDKKSELENDLYT